LRAIGIGRPELHPDAVVGSMPGRFCADRSG
jgi:hypothetical protein